YRRTAAVFAVSRQIEARCREVGIAAERVHWIPGSADLARFAEEADPRPVREEFELGEAPVIVSVARLAPNRGHELLLEGFRLLLREMPGARLLLVGKGETRARLEQVVADLGLVERVVFTGYRDRDLPAVLASADCFALMAAGSDDSCRAALEAMGAACPKRWSTARPASSSRTTGPRASRPRSPRCSARRGAAGTWDWRGGSGPRRSSAPSGPWRRSSASTGASRDDPPARLLPWLVVGRLLGRATHARAGAARARGHARLPRGNGDARDGPGAPRGRGADRDVRVRERADA